MSTQLPAPDALTSTTSTTNHSSEGEGPVRTTTTTTTYSSQTPDLDAREASQPEKNLTQDWASAQKEDDLPESRRTQHDNNEAGNKKDNEAEDKEDKSDDKDESASPLQSSGLNGEQKPGLNGHGEAGHSDKKDNIEPTVTRQLTSEVPSSSSTQPALHQEASAR